MDCWMAGWKNGDGWLSPAGKRISEPDEHKPATLEEILNYYEQEKLLAVDGFSLKS